MKKIFLGLLVGLLIFCIASSMVFAQEQAASKEAKSAAAEDTKVQGKALDTAQMSTTYGKTPFNKLTRGVLNMSTFYFEIPAGVMQVSKEKDNYFIGSTIGTAQGFFACILRALTAVFDTATFLIPPYNKPIMQPEYTIQSLEQAQE